MNISLFKKGFSLLYLLIGLLIINCGAANYDAFAGDDDGMFGMVRYRAPLRLTTGGTGGQEIKIESVSHAFSNGQSSSVVVFTGFGSEIAPAPRGNQAEVVPVLLRNNAFFNVVFRPTSLIPSVNITWRVDNPDTPVSPDIESTRVVNDPVTGGELDPNFIFFAWFKPASQDIPPSLYNVEIEVTTP